MEEPKQLKRKAKTHKGRKILKMREPQIKEGVKKTIFVRNLKSSENVLKTIKILNKLKKGNSVYLSKRIDLKPFEDVQKLEQLSQKNESAFVVLGSNSKKRPESLLFSRFYDN